MSWEAVGAIGTWVVGLAALWIAYEANSLAVRLKTSEDERALRASKALVHGIRIEVMAYEHHVRIAKNKLQGIIGRDEGNALVQVSGALEDLSCLRLSESTLRAAQSGSLPDGLANLISQFYASVNSSGELTVRLARIARQLHEFGEISAHDRASLQAQFLACADTLGHIDQKAIYAVGEMSKFLGVSDVFASDSPQKSERHR